MDTKEPGKQTDEVSLEKKQASMVLVCKSCGKAFDTTFTVEEFSQIPREQYESGTLHICPHCGNLSMYSLADYQEPG